jgi:hypothetical protein
VHVSPIVLAVIALIIVSAIASWTRHDDAGLWLQRRRAAKRVSDILRQSSKFPGGPKERRFGGFTWKLIGVAALGSDNW